MKKHFWVAGLDGTLLQRTSTMRKVWGVVVAVLSVASLLAVAVYCYILVFGVVAWLWDFSESVTHWVTVLKMAP